MADQLTALALPFYGDKTAKTPNLNKLAEQAVVFQNAYCGSPLCTPSRYVMLSGQHVAHCGGYDNASVLETLKPTFMHYLRLKGYETILAGKMHFVGPDQLHGFERRLTTDVYPADFGWSPNWQQPEERIDAWYHNMSSIAQSGISAISNFLDYDDEVGFLSVRELYHLARRKEKSRPFLHVCSFIHPHDPYCARADYFDRYSDKDIPLPQVKRLSRDKSDPHSLRLEKVMALDAVEITDEDIIRTRRAYYANISYLDDWLGKLMGVLKETDQLENTIIIFTSDHGDMLGERGLWYKMSFFEPSIRVPLMVSFPKEFAPKKVDTAVSLVDLLPTLCELAGYDRDFFINKLAEPIDGKSLLPLLKGNGEHQPTIAEYCAEGAIEPMLMIVDKGLKYCYAPSDPEQFFDLKNDPLELNNLAAQPPVALQPALARLQKMARDHWSPELLKKKIMENQYQRKVIHEALLVGHYTAWDYQPPRQASREFARSYMDLTEFDIASRFPRPKEFKPSFK